MDLTTLLGARPGVFLGLTVLLVGGAAVLAGRAVGSNWKPVWQIVAACVGLAAANRFLNYALFEGELLSPWGFVVSFLVILVLGVISWRIALVSKFVGQYPWKYARTSPFSYREISGA